MLVILSGVTALISCVPILGRLPAALNGGRRHAVEESLRKV